LSLLVLLSDIIIFYFDITTWACEYHMNKNHHRILLWLLICFDGYYARHHQDPLRIAILISTIILNYNTKINDSLNKFMKASFLYLPNGDVKLRLTFEIFYLSLFLSMIIYQLINVDDKFIVIKLFSWVFYSILYRRVV
jgi:hypothetical protein